MKGYRKYMILLGLLFTGFVAVEFYKPKPIDWEQTFSNKDKIPYGTFVLHDLLPDLFSGQEITVARLPIINQLEEETTPFSNYIFINEDFSADSLNQEALLEYVQKGNSVFISAYDFPESFQKRFGFSVEYSDFEGIDTIGVFFTNPSLKKTAPILYPETSIDWHFVIEEQKGQIALGKNTAGKVNFIKIPFGKGDLYLNTLPMVFTNFHLLKSVQADYAAIALSHLPVQPVLWDEYQKLGRTGDQSIFRVLMSHEALTWAYYISLFSLLLFVLFESKRTQRIIPVQEAPKNTTLEFVQVVGNLYFNHRNHKKIAGKKINYFFEFLRMHYFEYTHVLDDDFITRIASKSGVAQSLVADLFSTIEHIKASDTIDEPQLLALHQYLEDFYKQTTTRAIAR